MLAEIFLRRLRHLRSTAPRKKSYKFSRNFSIFFGISNLRKSRASPSEENFNKFFTVFSEYRTSGISNHRDFEHFPSDNYIFEEVYILKEVTRPIKLVRSFKLITLHITYISSVMNFIPITSDDFMRA